MPGIWSDNQGRFQFVHLQQISGLTHIFDIYLHAKITTLTYNLPKRLLYADLRF